MACLIKPPRGKQLGCVSFTTPERDLFMRNDAATLAAIESLKDRYLVGLHHNWHDFDFIHDPVFDFSMAGEADLIERSGRIFPRTPIDCCNFVPDPFFLPRNPQPFWDIINVTREAFFKGHAEFLEAIRAIYDRGRRLRVLHLCPVLRAKPGENPIPEIRRLHEAMFTMEERRSFTLLTMDWDHPRPLDLETLSFFYRSARVFVHTAPDERRCRIAAYAWANQMPVVARDNVASILPSELRAPPYYFGYEDNADLPSSILAAVESNPANADWRAVMETFRPQHSAKRLSEFLDELALGKNRTMSLEPINPDHLDFRLGRHHIATMGGPNELPQTVADFCAQLQARSDEELAEISILPYPEDALLSSANPAGDARIHTAGAQTVAPDTVRRNRPGFKSRFRTWLRKGHTIPLTGYRVVIDLLRDAKS
jgi:hypothetical protein